MKKILVIDDNENMLKMMCDLLTRSGYNVFSATDGVQGIKALHANTPDLVITDVIMPEKDGLEVIMDLKKHHPGLKSIVVSGGGILEPQAYLPLAKKLGADEVLAKPFRLAELLTLVQKLLA
jgi:CheY-like chemotaxis protein